MFIDSTGSADQYSQSDCVCNWDVLKFVIATIAGLGCVAMLGCGTAGYLKIGTFSTLQQIPSLSLISLGAAGLLATLITSVVLSLNREKDADASFWQRYGKKVNDIGMPDELKNAMAEAAYPCIPVLIPPIRDIDELKELVARFGFTLERSLEIDNYKENPNCFKNDRSYWVLWKIGAAFDLTKGLPTTLMPKHLSHGQHGGYLRPSVIEAVLCLLAEFSKNNNLATCTIQCEELQRLTPGSSSTSLNVDYRDKKITISVIFARGGAYELFHQQCLIKK